MSEILNAAKLQFRERMSAPLGRILIPEWTVDGKPAEIFFRPTMNFKQQGEVLRLASEGKQAEAVVLTLIFRALDADGKPLFRKVNQTEILNEMDPDLIGRIVGEMGGDDLTIEEMEKN